MPFHAHDVHVYYCRVIFSLAVHSLLAYRAENSPPPFPAPRYNAGTPSRCAPSPRGAPPPPPPPVPGTSLPLAAWPPCESSRYSQGNCSANHQKPRRLRRARTAGRTTPSAPRPRAGESRGQRGCSSAVVEMVSVASEAGAGCLWHVLVPSLCQQEIVGKW